MKLKEIVDRFYAVNNIKERYGISVTETNEVVKSYFRMIKDAINYYSIPRIKVPYIGSIKPSPNKVMSLTKILEKRKEKGSITEQSYVQGIIRVINWINENYDTLRPKQKERAKRLIEKYRDIVY